MTRQEFLDRMKIEAPRSFNFYQYHLIPEIVLCTDRIDIYCPTHGIFNQKTMSHLLGQGCAKCAGLNRKDTSTFIDQAISKHGERYDYSQVKYKNTRTKVKIICRTHGVFLQIPKMHLKGQGCRACANSLPVTTKEFIRRARREHGNRYDYSKVQVHGINRKVIIACERHGEFLQSPDDHMRGRGCARCSPNAPMPFKEFVEKANKIHAGAYSYVMIDPNRVGARATIVCPHHGQFLQRPVDHLRGHGCAMCNISHGERELGKILDEFSIRYLREYKIEGYRYSYDFYLPDQNILIEFHGQQHYKPVEYFGGEVEFLQIQERDKKKTILAQEKGIPLVVLNYSHLKSKSLDIQLKAALRSVYRHWIKENGKLYVFKTPALVAAHLSLPRSFYSETMNKIIARARPDIEILI